MTNDEKTELLARATTRAVSAAEKVAETPELAQMAKESFQLMRNVLGDELVMAIGATQYATGQRVLTYLLGTDEDAAEALEAALRAEHALITRLAARLTEGPDKESEGKEVVAPATTPEKRQRSVLVNAHQSMPA